MYDDRSAYREAMLRAEQAAGYERDEQGNESYTGETPDLTAELEGAVPVQASDQPLEPEPVETDTSEQQPEAPEAPEVVETVDERDARIAELEARLAEKDNFIGRQSTEIGDLRSAVDEIRAAQNTPAAPPAQLMPVTAEDIMYDAEGATKRAFENAKVTQSANDPVLARAYAAWEEEDKASAKLWLAEQQREADRAAYEQKLAALEERITTATAPIAKQEANNEWNTAFLEMQKTYGDFLTVDETGKTQALRLLEEEAPKFPAIARMIAEGDAATKVQGLTLLMGQSKLGNPELLQKELQDAAATATAEAEAARAAAGVVTSQATAGQGSEPEKSYSEREAEAYASRQRARPSLSRGWTGRGATP